MRTVALFFFASLLALSWAQSDPPWLAKVKGADSAESFQKSVHDAQVQVDPGSFVGTQLAASEYEEDWKAGQSRVVRAAEVSAAVAPPTRPAKVANAQASAKQILSKPQFRDPGSAQGRNWMSKAADRLGRAIKDFLDKLTLPRTNVNPGPIGLSMVGLVPLVLGILVIGLIGFLVYFLAKFQVVGRWRARRNKVLEDDEPDLTSDEWLARAAELEKDEHFREAVRCLYLATLVRLDEAGYLQFVRSDTNWEHLSRFEADPGRPRDLDLRQATRLFDEVWYGYRGHGAADSTWFRQFYSSVLESIKRGPS